MTKACPICQHPKIEAINTALDSGRSPKLVRYQFRLEPQMLEAHIVHRSALPQCLLVDDRNHLPAADSTAQPLPRKDSAMGQDRNHLVNEALQELSPVGIVEYLDRPSRLITENPYRQFTRGVNMSVDAYHLAKDDPRMQRQMQEYWRQKLEAILEREDMGLEWP